MDLEIMESLVQDALKTLNRTVATRDANSYREIQMYAESLKKMDLEKLTSEKEISKLRRDQENLKSLGGLKFRTAPIDVSSCLDLHFLDLILR